MILTDLVWPLAAVTSIVPVWYIVWSPLLTAYDQVRVVMWSSILTGVVNLSANLILIPQLGVIGSAWATVLAYSTTNLCAELMNRHGKTSEITFGNWRIYPPVVILAILGILANFGQFY
jgi:Na+-driven multidrug efflux pump